MAAVAQNQNQYFNMFSGLFGSRSRPVSPVVETPQLTPEKGATTTVTSEDRVDVVVGPEGKARTWRIHKDLLVQFSNYYATAAKAGTDEANAGKFRLVNQDPAVFEIFVTWLYSSDKEIKMGGPESELVYGDSWINYACSAYELGELLQAPKFSRFALIKFMQGIRFANPATLISIHKDGKGNVLKENCSLRRFTAAWLWYIRHTHALMWTVQTWWISEGDLADPVCGNLVRKMLKEKEFADSGATGLLEKTVDPHWLDIEHWYKECSANPLPHNCSHVPFPCNMNSWGTRQW